MTGRKMLGLIAFSIAVSIAGVRFARESTLQADEKVTKSLVDFTSDGKAKQPVGYRKWIFIGTPVTPNDLNGGEASFPEFHNTYIDPESFAHFEKTGEYRNGTVIIKELTSVGAKRAASGNGYFEGEFTGLEMSIKDSKRFPNEPGNWAYFSFGHKYPLKEVTAKNEVASCNACHEANAKKFVFSDYYPVLRSAYPPVKK